MSSCNTRWIRGCKCFSTYAVSGDTRMAENVLWDFRCSQLPDGILQSRTPCTHTQVIPDFSIYWIFMLEEFYWQTGRTDLIRFYRPVMDGVLDFDRHIGPSGLAEKLGYWEFGDWVDKWDAHAGTPDATYAGRRRAAQPDLCAGAACCRADDARRRPGRAAQGLR